MGKLILVRHGNTVLNSHDDGERLRGWMDVPLDEQGLREAEETAQRLAEHPVAHIFSSDLSRARKTAEAVERATGAAVLHTADLRPWNVGTLAGQRVKDILPILQELERDPSMRAPGGESFLSFCERYSRQLEDLLDIASHNSRHIIAVTHVRNLLAAPALLNGGDRGRIPVSGGPKTGSLVWVEKNGRGWKLRVDEAPVAAISGQGKNKDKDSQKDVSWRRLGHGIWQSEPETT